MESRRGLILLSLGLMAALWVGPTGSQQTFKRSCDCEYMTADGKCAYTLLLPTGGSMGSGSNNQMQCPEKDMDSQENRKQVMSHLEQLKANITDLKMVSGDQARMLSQLQSLLLSQQELLGRMGDRMRNNGSMMMPDMMQNMPGMASGNKSSGPMHGKNGNATGCQVCPELAQTIASQQVAITSVQEQVFQLAGSMSSIQQALANVDQLLPTDQLRQVLDQGRNQSMEVEKMLKGLQRNLTSQIQMSNPAACVQRGLLVSGKRRNITDDKITSSSVYDAGHAPVRGRIHIQADGALSGAWCAAEPNAPEEWLQFDMGTERSIFGIVTKGRSDYGQWVSSYSLNYTTTDPSTPGSMWMPYTNVLGETEIFMGNKDQHTAQVNMLWQPIRARFIRIIPLTSDSNKCLRADVIGCLDEQ